MGSVGSIGLALFLWVIGGIIAAAGLAVYLVREYHVKCCFHALTLLQEWATAIPRSGGEKNVSSKLDNVVLLSELTGNLQYLEFSYRKPLYLITCVSMRSSQGHTECELNFQYTRHTRCMRRCWVGPLGTLCCGCSNKDLTQKIMLTIYSTGEMLLNAAGTEVDRWNQRAIGVAVVTFALLVHGIRRK